MAIFSEYSTLYMPLSEVYLRMVMAYAISLEVCSRHKLDTRQNYPPSSYADTRYFMNLCDYNAIRHPPLRKPCDAS